MKKHSTIVLLIVLLLILIIGAFFAIDYFENKKGGDIYDVFKLKENEEEASKINPDSLSYVKFTSEDEKFTINYPESWIKSEIKDLSQVASKEVVEKYNLEMPLMITLPAAGKLVQLAVTKYEFDAVKKIDTIIEELMGDTEVQGVSAEIISKKTSEDLADFEAKYTQNGLNLHSKEKLFLLPTKENTRIGYVASFLTLEKDWNEYEKVADFIISSARAEGVEEIGNVVEGEKKFGGYLSELYLAKLPRGQSLESTSSGAPAPANQFDFSEDQFCAIGFIIKPYEEAQAKIYKAGTNNMVFADDPMDLGTGKFGGCQKMALEPGTYDFNMYFDGNLAASIPFYVK